jgi:hypothetical protein
VTTQSEAVAKYYENLKRGMNPNDAYADAVQGMPTQEDIQKDAGDKQQQSGLASVGGSLVGIVATKYLYEQLSKQFGGEAAKKIIENAGVPAKTTTEAISGVTRGGGSHLTEAVNSGTQSGAAASGETMYPGGANYPAADPQVIDAGQPIPEGHTAVATNPETGQQAVVENGALEAGAVNWNAIGQGALALFQVYNAYQAYEDGDYVGAGLAGSSAAASGAAAAGSSTGAAASGPLAAAAIVYQGYQNERQASKNANGGAYTSEEVENISNPFAGAFEKYLGKELGGGINELAKYAMPYHKITDVIYGSNKDDDQLYRDRVRKRLQEKGILDENWNYSNEDGSKFDMGKDGSTRNYNTDDTNPLTASTIPLIDPITEIITGGNEKLRSDFTAYFTRAVTEGAKTPEQVEANVQNLITKLGLTKEQVDGTLTSLVEDERIDQQRADVYRANISRFNLPSEATGTDLETGADMRTSTTSPGIGADGRRITDFSNYGARKPTSPLVAATQAGAQKLNPQINQPGAGGPQFNTNNIPQFDPSKAPMPSGYQPIQPGQGGQIANLAGQQANTLEGRYTLKPGETFIDFTNQMGNAMGQPQYRDNAYVVGRDGPAPQGGVFNPAMKADAMAQLGAQRLPSALVQAVQRSKTRSPGIGLDGRRIQY